MPVEAVAKPELVAAAPAEAKSLPKEMVVNLSAPVQAHGETITKLTFRRPTANDLIALGDGVYPVNVFPGAGIRLNSPAMAELMTSLAQVPMSTIKQLEAKDFTTCAIMLTPFFIPDAVAWQTW
jgi:hypothetical protein